MKYSKIIKQLKKLKEVCLKYPNNNQEYINALITEIDFKLAEIDATIAIEREILEDYLDFYVK